MKRVVAVLFWLGSVVGCKQDSLQRSGSFLPVTVGQSSYPDCFDSRPFVRQAVKLTGRVSFSTEEDMYVISYNVPGTYDSVWIGYVCNLPDDYKVLAKQVVFSGEYRKGPAKPVTFAGAEFYYLFLTAIH